MAPTTKRAATKATAAKKTTARKTTARKTTAKPVDVSSPAFVAAVAAAVQATLASQQSTPAAVAEAVTVDPVQALVDKHGLSFAKGGRAYLTLDAFTAGARVLKTGTPEVVKAADEKSHERRSVSHVVLFRTEAGNVGVHPLYKGE